MADYKVKSKSWCFTINNPREDDDNWMAQLECSYIIGGHEVGKEGTPHIQGFVTFKRTYSLQQIKKVHSRAHWEIAKCDDAMNYCMKDGDVYVRDERKKKGQRTDLEATYTAVTEGKTLKQFIALKPNFQALRVFEIAKAASQEPRRFKPHVTWIWGPTGTGKTRQVVEKEPSLWISSKNLKWWQGYENQEATLFDDFRGDFCTYHELLRILDRYPFTVEVKGGSRELNSQRMYITSCYPPETVYQTKEDKSQLLRRIDQIIFTGTDTGTGTKVGEGNTKSPTEWIRRMTCGCIEGKPCEL